MSEDEKPDGPDFTQGVPGGNIAEGRMLAGHVGADAVLIARVNGALHAIGAECTHYHGPLAEGLIKDGAGALPVAPCLLQPDDRRGRGRSGVRPGRLLRGGGAGRQGLRHGQDRDHAAERRVAGDGERGGDRRRRGWRLRGGGDAAAQRLRWRAYPAQRRRRRALRPAELFQGFPLRRGGAGMDAAAGRRLLQGPQDRSAPEHRGREPRFQFSDRDRRGWRDPVL